MLQFLFVLPSTTDGIWAWFLSIYIAYTVVRKIVARLRGSTAPTTMERMLDAATFSGSVLLLIGIFNPITLKAVGDTTGFLILGGAGGFFYTAEKLLSEGSADADDDA